MKGHNKQLYEKVVCDYKFSWSEGTRVIGIDTSN